MSTPLYFGKVVGVTFEPAKSNVNRFVECVTNIPKEEFDPKVILTHHPENQYDCNAIRVTLTQGDRSFEVGWIPKGPNKAILDVGLDNVVGRFVDFNTDYDGVVHGFTVSVEPR